MRLYLNAKSKNNVGYTPDWLQVTYDENGKQYELNLDIRGEIDYDPTSLSCRCKGDLIPWILRDLDDDDEIDLSELSEEEIESLYPNKKLAEIFEKGYNFLIGIYPVVDDTCFDDDDDFDDYFETVCENDILSDCIGEVELYLFEEEIEYTKEFEFDTELNIY